MKASEIIKALLNILGVIGGLVMVVTLIDKRIDTRMSDPAFIRQVASQVRPALIFDSNGSIVADLGAWQYFDEITVHLNMKEDAGPGEIVLKPKSLLQYPPDISGLGGINIVAFPERGPGLVWRYRVDALVQFQEMPKPYRFRLEVIK